MRGHARVKSEVRTAHGLSRTRVGASLGEVQSVRDQAFADLMQYVYAHLSYYRNVMQARSLTPGSFRGLGDLAKLPILTKEIIRREGRALRADRYPDAACTVRRSGGTTGEPIPS